MSARLTFLFRHFVFAALALGWVCAATANAASIEKPNLILILADDLSASALSCYGGESVRTPVLDGMAEEGMRYSHCFSPALCMPSRTELLTGRYSHRNYLNRGNLAPGEANIASELKKAGYATCQVEKWHLNINGGAMPAQAGFDEYYHTKLAHNYSRTGGRCERQGANLPRWLRAKGVPAVCLRLHRAPPGRSVFSLLRNAPAACALSCSARFRPRRGTDPRGKIPRHDRAHGCHGRRAEWRISKSSNFANAPS